MRKLLSTLIVALAGTLVASQAGATPNFPDAVKQHLVLTASPPCTLCHTGGVTQRGTVTTPFGTSMRARGLVAYDEASLTAALDTMARDKIDSDGDGVPDIDELKAGTDPNVPDANPDGGGGGRRAAPIDLPVAPDYGCAASGVSVGRSDGLPLAAAVVAAAAVALALRAARRRAGGAVAACAAIWIVGCRQEPLDVAPDVDLRRLEGRWFEIAKFPRVTQADCTATTAYYRLKSDVELELRSECRLGDVDGERRTMTANVRVEDPTVPAKLAIQVAGFWGSFWVLEVGKNYEYAVLGHPTRDYLWIMSRTPALEPRVIDAILERARAKRFDTSRLEFTRQGATSEACRTCADNR